VVSGYYKVYIYQNITVKTPTDLRSPSTPTRFTTRCSRIGHTNDFIKCAQL